MFPMKRNPSNTPLFVLVGICLWAVSLLTGCAWSAEGEGFRIHVAPDPADEVSPP
jgi:hypothetical protein